VVDPVKSGFDVALQIFPPRSEELVSRRLFPVRRVFCASPEYLRARGTPKHPHDLFGHRLGLYSGYPTRDRWVFHRPGTESVTVELKPTLMSNSVHLLREYGCEHAGIVCLPTLVASEWIVRGRLRLVLADFPLSSFWLSAVYPRTQRGVFKLKLFIESLAASFAGGEPPWDKVLIEKGVLPAALVEE
jgi:DNA-binding transcriptional LysR family regulator